MEVIMSESKKKAMVHFVNVPQNVVDKYDEMITAKGDAEASVKVDAFVAALLAFDPRR